MSSDYNLNIEEESNKPNALAAILLAIPRKVRIVLCIVLVTWGIIAVLGALKPEAKKRPIPETVVRVDVVSATRSTYPIIVSANGTIEAETRGNLVAQISGEIVATANSFKTGGTFSKGEVLIEIDPRDFQAQASQSLANLSRAQANYRSEQANARQAKLDWERLGNTEPAPDLVLRKPQLAAAKAELDSARAVYDSAQLNLSRTKITAPYDGRIIQRSAVLGQYLTVGSPIAEVFKIDGVEVRLPISQEEFSQLGLDAFDPSNTSDEFSVVIFSEIGGQRNQWNAKITRTNSTFDINTRQIDVIAEVDNPFSQGLNQPPLKIGQFVEAQITGRAVDNVFVIPNKSIREGSYVYVVRDDKLAKQGIKILWQDDQNALLADGLSDNELVVTTSLNSTLAGATAKLSDDVQLGTPALAESQTEPVASDVSSNNTEIANPAEGIRSNKGANQTVAPQDEQTPPPASTDASSAPNTPASQ